MSVNFVQKSKKDVWQTPKSLWKPIDEQDNINLDPCAAEDTSIGDVNYTVEDDGLSQTWFGTVWLNPPFSQKDEWLDKVRGERENCERIYIVTPDSTNVQSWWHGDLVELCDYCWFSNGRVDYIDPESGEIASPCAFGTAINVVGKPPSGVIDWMQENGDFVSRVK